MSVKDKVLTILEKIGHGFKVGLDEALKAEPFVLPFLSAVNPAAGAALATTVAVISQTEQKFAALGQQSGTGQQKLTEATTILQPLLSIALADAGSPASLQKIQGYISAVVAIMNTPAEAVLAPAS